jgi:hypothetical protein
MQAPRMVPAPWGTRPRVRSGSTMSPPTALLLFLLRLPPLFLYPLLFFPLSFLFLLRIMFRTWFRYSTRHRYSVRTRRRRPSNDVRTTWFAAGRKPARSHTHTGMSLANFQLQKSRIWIAHSAAANASASCSFTFLISSLIASSLSFFSREYQWMSLFFCHLPAGALILWPR